MLTGTDADPNQVVGRMSNIMKKNWSIREKVAVNAVMAGCRPEHLPVLAIAATQHPSLPVPPLRLPACFV